MSILGPNELKRTLKTINGKYLGLKMLIIPLSAIFEFHCSVHLQRWCILKIDYS